jgi:cytochrome c biogenesis protein
MPALPLHPRGRQLLELLASMRFSISLLSLICIASVIGTVVMQRQPAINYVNQFGPYWSELFGRINLYTVYSAPWFLLILAFLVVSTSLCIVRQTPKILRDWKDAKLKVRAESLKAYPHKAQADWPLPLEAAHATLTQRLQQLGWSPKVDARGDGTLLAARKGKVHKLGYLSAHGAIVLVCVGGLLDGDLMVKLAMKMQGKEVFAGTGSVASAPEKHQLSTATPSFRGNLFVPEGARANTALLNLPGGVLLQPLPFELELKKFVVEYYETGMPKLFASEVVLTDGTERKTARIEVNKPLVHKGFAIYQSSFEDGGSQVSLHIEPFGLEPSYALNARVGDPPQALAGTPLQLEVSELRVINVEDFGKVKGAQEAASAPAAGFASHLGSGAKAPGEKTLRNIGPSLTYRLRDAAGQAREFHNYMVPTNLDGVPVFLVGMREEADAEFRYLRLPADENFQLQGWLRLRRALANPTQLEQAARSYAEQATDKPDLRPQIVATALRALGLFAGTEAQSVGGLAGLSNFVEREVPASERERISGVLLRILNGSLLELDHNARRAAGVPIPEPSAERQAFMTQAVLSLSDSVFYPAPLLIRLETFEQRQASVFQVARAPGQKLVYLGAILLIIGVFAMLYIRERRLWIWLAPNASGGTLLMLALSSPRRTLDTDAEFDRLKAHLLA